MIVSFKLENFLSFKEEIEFSMVAKPYQRYREHVHSNENLEILKLSAIYGANASGKSNFVNGLKFLMDIVTGGYGPLDQFRLKKFRLDDKSESQPTVFKITFLTEANSLFEFILSIGKDSILKETLNIFNGKKKNLIYNRLLQKDGTYRLDYPDTQVRSAENKIRLQVYQEELLSKDSPFLSMAEKVSSIIDFEDAYYWFFDQLQFISPKFYDSGRFMRLYVSDENFRNKANSVILNTKGLGIKEIKLNKTDINEFFGASQIDRKHDFINKLDHSPLIFFEQNDREHVILRENGNINVLTLHFCHKSNYTNHYFELNEESDGTRRLLHLLPSIIDSIDQNKVYIIDEIDRSMHPILIKELLQVFISKFKSDLGQMIFTTHESYLMDLDILRQDEYWFVEKEEATGSSVMYSLIEFKPRFDLNIQKGYLTGKFGAIPFIDNKNQLL